MDLRQDADAEDQPSSHHEEPGAQHFNFADYAHKGRWASYWHQLDELFTSEPSNCLIVGAGDKLVVDVLRAAGVTTTSADIVPELRPDVLADVRALPFVSRQFDAVACCQVLEHVPYDTVPQALQNLARVTKRRLVLSVPDITRSVRLQVALGQNRQFYRKLEIPSKKTWAYNGVHHWELGTTNFRVDAFTSLLEEHVVMERMYTVPEYPYHRFFVGRPK